MKPTSTTLSHQEEFPYGWRYVQRGDTLEQVPLTLEDVLHPQEGDAIPGNTQHDDDCFYLKYAFSSRSLSPPFGLVTHDVIVNWGVAGIGNHSPDFGVFVGLGRDPRPTGLLELKSLGGRCELAVEVVSPSTRSNDVVRKLDHYYRIGIPLYVILDQEDEGGPRWLLAYRHTPAGYVEVPPDDQGRIALPPLGLLLGLREDHPVCFDAATGEEVRHPARLNQEHQRYVEQAIQQKEEADRAITEQVDARQAAERLAAEVRKEAERVSQEAQRREAEARKEVERLSQEAERVSKEAESARKETESARKEANRALLEVERVSKEAERDRRARELADQRIREADQRAREADQRIRELEESLRRFQAGGSSDTTNP